MICSGCPCSKITKSEEVDNHYLHDENLSNTSFNNSLRNEQFEEINLIYETNKEMEMKNSELLNTSANNGELHTSTDVELIFYESPVHKSVPISELLETSQRSSLIEVNQLPLKSSVIYSESPPLRRTADAAMVRSPVSNSYRAKVRAFEEPSLSQEHTGNETAEIISELSWITPSVIFRPYKNQEQYPRIRAKSLENIKTQVRKMRQRSYSWGWGRGRRANFVANQIATSIPNPVQVNSGFCSDLWTKESKSRNSLYSSGSESSQNDNECVWATFIPITPNRGCETSISITAGSSLRTSQLEKVKNNGTEQHPKIENRNFAMRAEVTGEQVDSINFNYGAIQRVIV